MARNVLIVGALRQAKRLALMLKAEGYGEIHLSPDCGQALEAAGRLTPDVVIIDADQPGQDPLRLVRELLEGRPLPIVMYSSYDRIDKVLEADEMGVSSHLFRPITRKNLLGALELGISRFRQCQALHAEVGDCKEALRVRKVIERAKGILMRRNSFDEEQAYLRIQKLSRDSNVPMEKVADSIITADEIM